MYYIQTADRLTRTSKWLEAMEGGIEYLRDVIINDRLQIADELERQAQFLVESYRCEWREVVKDPERRRMFRQFVNTDETEPGVEFVVERGQRHPAGWPSDFVPLQALNGSGSSRQKKRDRATPQARWHRVGCVSDFPKDAGACVKCEGIQIAVYRFSSRNEWHACQNMCPHKRELVLSRGILGDQGGVPKVACPVHKKAFSLESGKCLSGEDYAVKVFPVKVEGDDVYVQVPVAQKNGREGACCVLSASFRRNRGRRGTTMSGVLTSPPQSGGFSLPSPDGRVFDHRNALAAAAGDGRRALFACARRRKRRPLQARYYRDLIPLNAPKQGEQYAFEVDLDSCSGCKACVTACHNLNGLDEDEVWRKVGLLSGGSSQLPVIQHVSTACHHCVEPACMEGCPVLAYEKDPITGIVRHLDDQCIGCQYCVLKCPYDVPRYSKKMGIVRKCDMCSSRLAVGEAPACVQACPNEAIRITVVNKEAVSAKAAANLFLPGRPSRATPSRRRSTRPRRSCRRTSCRPTTGRSRRSIAICRWSSCWF